MGPEATTQTQPQPSRAVYPGTRKEHMNVELEIAKKIIAEMEDTSDKSPAAKKHLSRIALIDYRLFLLGRKSYSDLCLVRAKAMQSGVSEQQLLDESCRMRQMWAAGKLR
jgi:hypothetical protein